MKGCQLYRGKIQRLIERDHDNLDGMTPIEALESAKVSTFELPILRESLLRLLESGHVNF